jgi:hypothetical protein
MYGEATMAKAKKGHAGARVRRPEPGPLVTRALKMTQEYADWLDKFASMERTSLAALFDRALASHAQRENFQQPPARIP